MKSFLSFLAVALLVSMTIAGLFVAGLVFYGNREPALGGDFSLTLRGNPWRFSSEPRDLNILYIGY
ncbi:MAG: SCO family protein, partial [Bdellovibrionaceae bacterium]|nr:SCO family protein [Pseudobdellovibrionaceae bacterium]